VVSYLEGLALKVGYMAKNKKIKHVSQLPEWFDLSKYKPANNLDTIGWYEQLSSRSFCFFKIAFSNEDRNSLLGIIRRKPIIDLTECKEIEGCYIYERLSDVRKFCSFKYAGVYAITVREIFDIINNISPEKIRYMMDELNKPQIGNVQEVKQKIELDNELGIDNKPAYESFTENALLLSEKWRGYNSVPGINTVNVNLHMPNSVLIESFKEWLYFARIKTGISNADTYKKSDYNRWILYGVLPYIDLFIWQQETKIKIPNRVMTDAIFPQGYGGEETIRKTTEPLALRLIGILKDEWVSPLDLLYSQALHERSKQMAPQKAEASDN
jgi:hypothetical protein